MDAKALYDQNSTPRRLFRTGRLFADYKLLEGLPIHDQKSTAVVGKIFEPAVNHDSRRLLASCCDLFKSLSEHELDYLTSHIVIRSFGNKTVVLHEQDVPNSLYIVGSGRVKMTKLHEDGREIVLSILSTGDYFGETTLIDSGPSLTSVIALGRCWVATIHQTHIQALLMRNPQFVLNLTQGLTKRLRQASRKIACLALMDVYQRIVSLFDDLAIQRDGKTVVSDPLTHQDIACMVGCSREMVSRILKDLVTGGYVRVEKRIITIRKPLPASW